MHMNNPKTLQSGPVAERMEQGNADFLKHEKAKLKKKCVGGVRVMVRRGEKGVWRRA